ncbi:MAG: HK97 gp10 family phage protein [Pseudobutyrivibrio sp.]|nr:HK97 gp10 family phage protein [Pseudobutyrivibrio sp.]
MSVIINDTGDFSKTFNFFDKIVNYSRYVDLNKYGKMGVEALKNATPKNTGITSESWYYTIEYDGHNKAYRIIWSNSNITDENYLVTVLLQYGHATGNGGYVSGTDYINPALKPIFDNISRQAWEEVKNS